MKKTISSVSEELLNGVKNSETQQEL
jgi:hypothetical protein